MTPSLKSHFSNGNSHSNSSRKSSSLLLTIFPPKNIFVSTIFWLLTVLDTLHQTKKKKKLATKLSGADFVINEVAYVTLCWKKKERKFSRSKNSTDSNKLDFIFKFERKNHIARWKLKWWRFLCNIRVIPESDWIIYTMIASKDNPN